MKKFICIILIAVTMVLLCVGCTHFSDTADFRVGFGRASIQPNAPIPLAGYFDVSSRISQGTLDPLYATCIAIQDLNGDTVLLYSIDLVRTVTAWVPELRKVISDATGVAQDKIMLSATHTHSAPDVGGRVNNIHPYYTQILKPGLVDAGKAAMEDLASASVQTGSQIIYGMNNIRHWVDEDGMYFGGNFGSKEKKSTAKFAKEPDRQMQLIRFCRENEKDILLVNWQGHPKLSSGGGTTFGKANRPYISADYVGWTRTHVEANEDLLFAFFLGASGNINPYDAYTGTSDPELESPCVYGERLGTYILDALKHLQTTPSAQIQTQQVQFPGVTPNGITVDIEINAIIFGDISFVTVPYEMFDTNGCAVKDASPTQTTFVLTCANGRHQYIPAEYAWDYPTADGSVAYEVSSCKYQRGTGEAIADQLIQMLNELAGK